MENEMEWEKEKREILCFDNFTRKEKVERNKKHSQYLTCFVFFFLLLLALLIPSSKNTFNF